MKRWIFLVGFGLGFLSGSRAGEGPYRAVEARVRDLTRRPAVHQTMEAVGSKAAEFVDEAADRVSEAMSTSSRSAA